MSTKMDDSVKTPSSEKKGTLTVQEKSTLKKMFLYSHLVFQNFNMTKMQANGFTIAMAPAIEELYAADKKGKSEAYVRHNAFFNTHAVAFNFIAGLSYALERDAAQGKVPGKTIEAIKASLMGPTVGMFDSLFFNCLRVIGAGIGIGLCAQGNILGSLIFILFYGVSQSVLKWVLLKTGYTLGTSFIDTVYSSGLMAVATKAASILGLTMVGAMTATTVNVPLNWTLNIGDASLVVLDLFESIYPGILSVIAVCLMLALIKKGARPIWLIFGLIAFCMVGAMLGIF